MTIAWRIEDFPDPFTPVIKFTRAFGSIVNEPCVIKFSNVILQMFPSLYWLWKRFVGKSNWGRNRGELVFDDVRTGVLWFDKLFARFLGVVAEIFSLLLLFLEDILFAHADKSVRTLNFTRCVVTTQARSLHQANRLRLVVKTGSQNFKQLSRNLYFEVNIEAKGNRF